MGFDDETQPFFSLAGQGLLDRRLLKEDPKGVKLR
jgi:hypothetical protein